MRIKFDADGFRRDMLAYAERKMEQIQQATELACREIENTAKDKCPKGKGSGDGEGLHQSITHKVDGSGAKFVGTVGSALEYAPYVHEGTGIHSRKGNGRADVPWSYMDEQGNWHTTDGIEPTPFLEDAVNETRDRVLQIYIDALKG